MSPSGFPEAESIVHVRTAVVALLALAAVPVVPAGSVAPGVLEEDSCGDPYYQLGSYYVVVDTGGIDLVWLYTETNGKPFLQRGGRSTLGYTDPCRETPYPDHLVF